MLLTPEHHLCTRCSCELTHSLVYVASHGAPFCSTCAIKVIFCEARHPMNDDGTHQKFPYRYSKPYTSEELAQIPTADQLEAQFNLAS